MAKSKTCSVNWCLKAASEIERHADESLNNWIVCGQTDRYSQDYCKAAALRHAATIKNIGDRRSYLKRAGFEA